jgi:lipopolysaccharide biosynthesis glycosyltransferase
LAQAIPLVFCFDQNYGAYATVAIASALAHADGFYRIYCLYGGDDDAFPREITALADRYTCEIHRIDLPKAAFRGWMIRDINHFSEAAYYRLLISQVVPETRVIYLDCDLVVTCGLSQLFAFDLQGKWIAGRPDPHGVATSGIRLPPGDPYLNSGVLLMDVEALRRHRPFERVREIYAAHESEVMWADQCVINKLAEGSKAVLPPQWNVLMHAVPLDQTAAHLAAHDGRGVIHFSGRTKPWMEWSPTSMTELWARYARVAGFDPGAVRTLATDVGTKANVARRMEMENDWRRASDTWREVALFLIDHLKAAS